MYGLAGNNPVEADASNPTIVLENHMKNIKYKPHLVLLIFCILAQSCGYINYNLYISNSLKSNVLFRQFKELYPDSFYNISYFNEEYGSTVLQGYASIYGRYSVMIYADVKKNTVLKNLEITGPVKFTIIERELIDIENGEVTRVKSTKNQLQFNENQWRKLFEANGDFSVLGFQTIKNNPIENFELYWKQLKKQFEF